MTDGRRKVRLVCAPGVSQEAVDLLEIALDASVADDDVFMPTVIVARHCDWAGARELSRTICPDYVRVGCDGDRLWIGPWFREAGSETERTFENRLRLNHPRPTEWDALFSAEATDRAKTFPLTACIAEIAALLIVEATRPAPYPVFFVFHCSTGNIERHTLIADPDVSPETLLDPDSAEAAVLRFEPRLKADPRAYRLPNTALGPASIERLVDRRGGLVKHVFHDIEAKLMPMAVAESSLPGELAPSTTYGRSSTVTGSRMVATLEAAERFSGTRPRGRRMAVRATKATLGDTAMDPAAFVLHSPAQQEEPGFNLAIYSDELEQDWIWTYSMRHRRPVLAPAQLFYYGIADRPGLPVNRYVYETSSGCALGSCLEEATLHALFEVIERDAYMCGWYGRFPYSPIDCSAVRNSTIDGLLMRARAEGYDVHLFDMTLEFEVPSIWAMIEDVRPGAPVRSYCAAAAHLDPEQAVISALVEVISSMSVYRNSMRDSIDRARALIDNPALVQRMEDHVLLFSQPETMEWLDFLPRTERPLPLRERFPQWYGATPSMNLTEELEWVTAAVLKVAEDVLVVDQSFQSLEPLSLTAVRVNAPGLLPISFGHQFRRVSLERVQNAADFLGLGRTYSAETLNPRPHNFP